MGIYILDRYRRPVPQGVAGAYTSGDGVAKGYLNREHLYPRRFLANPFDVGDDPLMYKQNRRPVRAICLMATLGIPRTH